ncbi:DUF2284 domain-containing protein [Candidatus Sumerlaeota bacterium]|nr:DUF2284 domain-containing protein [Candidatus Sumerlaeota bacterium]
MRERYIARLMSEPWQQNFTAIKFVHMPQIVVNPWVRQRCQFLCTQSRQSDLCPPFSPNAAETAKVLEDYKFGLMIRREETVPFTREVREVWREFQDALVEVENESFVRGYGKAFAMATGNCVFCHHDDSLRPCEFIGKRRPTMEAIGINLYDTLDMIGWRDMLFREVEEPLNLFGLLLLE